MKLRVFSYTIVILMIGMTSLGAAYGQPVIGVVPDTLNFGNVPIQQFLQDTILVLNRGTDTLVIRGVETSCGCTSATPQSSKIVFMGTAVVRVSVNIVGKRGMFTQWIHLNTNDPKTPVVEIPVIANIVDSDSLGNKPTH